MNLSNLLAEGTTSASKSRRNAAVCVNDTKLATSAHCSQARMREWLPFRQSFLDELLRHDGLGGYMDKRLCDGCIA